MQKRMNSYDLLRILSTFMVMLIHVNAHYFVPLSAKPASLSSEYIAESIFNIVTRFSVPCFVMISGAFNLRGDNREYKKFYTKVGYKIVLPFVILSLLILFLVEIAVSFGIGYDNHLTPVIEFVTGSFMNWWFMFMIIGLYIITPVLVRFKESVSSKAFVIVTLLWLFLSFVSQSTTEYGTAYSIGIIFSYAGYYMLGNVIYEKMKPVKWYGLLVVPAVVLWLAAFLVRYMGFDKYVFSAYASFFSPAVMLSSICIFIIFSNLHVSIGLEKLSGHTYYMYLFHTLIYLIIFFLLDNRIIVCCPVTIILVTLMTFCFSWLCSILYQIFWAFLERKWNLKEKWYKRMEKL